MGNGHTPELEEIADRHGKQRSRVTLLVGIEMSFFGIEIFRSSFRHRDPFDLQVTQCRAPKKHAWVDPRKKTISMPNSRMQNLNTKKKISIKDLGHLDTTKETFRYQKRCTPKNQDVVNFFFLGGVAVRMWRSKSKVSCKTWSSTILLCTAADGVPPSIRGVGTSWTGNEVCT